MLRGENRADGEGLLFEAKWPREETCIAGVSGGLDSMVLWHALLEAGYGNVVAVHVDHGLRGEESKRDAEFVRCEAERLGVRSVVVEVKVEAFAKRQRVSIETAARELRYRSFAETAEAIGARKVFLAHHADDRVETVMMHLFRGAGSRGLAGMAEESRRIVCGRELHLVRPLLALPRERLARYAQENGIEWREDSTNLSDFALRNRIRHRLLPEIEAVFGRDVRAAVLRAADLAALDEAWARESLPEAPRASSGNGLAVDALLPLHAAARRRLLLAWLRSSGVPDCGLAEVARTEEVLLSKARPAKASLPGGNVVRRRAGELFIEPSGTD